MPTKIKYVMKHGKDSTQLQFEVEHGEHQFVTLLPWSQTHVLVKNKGKPTNNNKILTQVFISLICKNDYIFSAVMLLQGKERKSDCPLHLKDIL